MPRRLHRCTTVLGFVAVACGPISGVPLGGDPADADAGGGDTTASESSSTGEPACDLSTLDGLTIGQVYIDAGVFTDIARGSSRQLRLATIVAGYPQDVDACVTWSVTPETHGMISDAGLVFAAHDAQVGSQITVTANIEQGRRILELDMMIYEPMVTPILGIWSEQARVSCDGGGGTFFPPSPVGELALFDNGEFRVTWTPFEAYVDYWGAFTHSLESGALTLTVSGGNSTPPDLDAFGTALVTEDGTLELAGMYLGSAPGDTPTTACGHHFR